MRRGSNNKFGARKVVVDGHEFDSRGEAERFCELKMMQRAGLISGLEIQPKFELQPGFKRLAPGGKVRTISAIRYTADFTYVEGPYRVVEDFKGVETRDFKLRRVLFIKKYPDVLFRVSGKGKAHEEWYPT